MLEQCRGLKQERAAPGIESKPEGQTRTGPFYFFVQSIRSTVDLDFEDRDFWGENCIAVFRVFDSRLSITSSRKPGFQKYRRSRAFTFREPFITLGAMDALRWQRIPICARKAVTQAIRSFRIGSSSWPIPKP